MVVFWEPLGGPRDPATGQCCIPSKAKLVEPICGVLNQIWCHTSLPEGQKSTTGVMQTPPDLLDQSVTFVWILIRTNIRIYSYQENYTNEYPNVFVSKFLTQTREIKQNHCRNIIVSWKLDKRIYSNISVSKSYFEQILEYIRGQISV